ncbi:insulinase family protein [Litoribacter ruber]|uniref:M16 family metallopeptidase n=1 Tax=Litoribacter ruber TaxID=702568 RepID=UPI001BD99DBD|nr:pitrilysin family protein [Litoribacter ruber]MBT0810887.1 insulinase family protein [Litoribacter ruber]
MTLDRSKAPEFKIPQNITLTHPNKLTLKNGINLYFIHTPHIDAVKLEVITEANKHLLPSGKALVPFFTLHMLLEGTKTMGSAEIDSFFDHYASEVNVISGFEQSGMSLLTTKKHFMEVLPVFRSLFTEAVFPEKELAKRKSQKELTISIQREETGARANQLYRKALFGKEHPYGFVGEEVDVQNVFRQDLVDFYQTSLMVNPEIYITGNLSDAQVEAIAKNFEDLTVLDMEGTLPDYDIYPERRIAENRDKAVQSSLRLGQHLISKTHPDYHALTVFNTILGGYFGSRLIKNIREDKGHTYGIYSSIGSLRLSDYWIVMADVQKGNADLVIDEVYTEIDKLQQHHVGTDELETVRNYMIGHFLSSFSSAFDLISRFKNVNQAGLSFDFYDEQLAFIRQFTADDVQKVAQRYFNKNGILEVVVG